MRNPVAHLVRPAAARPSLRDRAAALKASASRVIGRKPVDAPAPAIDDGRTLAARVIEYFGNDPLNPDLDCDFRLRTMAQALLDGRSATVADPILAAIAETRRLTLARAVANNLPIPAGDLGPLPEQDAAMNAQFAHIDNVLLKTVPTTAAGCAALARYALDFLAADGWALDEDANNNQHVRLLDLIARSPMLDSVTTADPVFAALGRYRAARAAWDAFSDRIDREGWDAVGGIESGAAEDGRLSCAWSDLSSEVLATAPTTDAGRIALADFVETWVADHGNADGSPQDGSETVFGRGLSGAAQGAAGLRRGAGLIL